MQSKAVSSAGKNTHAHVLDRYLKSENEVLRSAAIKALSENVRDVAEIRSILLEALLDPDPDIRSDAMEAMADHALPEDAETIVFSLEQDPVREVKLAAIEVLVRLQATDTIELLRALCLSRSEERIAWEDQNSDWEDWLDIQIAAIKALGRLGAVEAIDDLLAARDDEYGQMLDIEVFGALGQLDAPGTEVLFELLEKLDGLARKRVAETIKALSPEALSPHADQLLSSEDVNLRILAISLLDDEDTRAGDLIKNDAAPAVRIAAINHFSKTRPDLAGHALLDDDEAVQAAGLDNLRPPFTPEMHDALVNNMLAWLPSAGSALTIASINQLPKLAPNRAQMPLLALIEDHTRPLETRIAAVNALQTSELGADTSTIVDLLSNTAQQVRTASVRILQMRASSGDDEAIAALSDAIKGILLTDEQSVIEREAEEGGADLAAPKHDGAARKIRITPEGEIIDLDDDQAKEQEAGSSTLSSILTDENVVPIRQEPEMAEDTPEESNAKRRRRRAVEGPDQIADSLCLDVLNICAEIDHEDIGAATHARLFDANATIKRAAWQALVKRNALGYAHPENLEALVDMTADPDAVVRMAAFELLLDHSDDPELMIKAQADEDALIRAIAVSRLPAQTALDFLADPSSAVRKACLQNVTADGSQSVLDAAVVRLVTAERSDTLADLINAAPNTMPRTLAELEREDLAPRKALVLLQALGEVRPDALV